MFMEPKTRTAIRDYITILSQIPHFLSLPQTTSPLFAPYLLGIDRALAG